MEAGGAEGIPVTPHLAASTFLEVSLCFFQQTSPFVPWAHTAISGAEKSLC